MLAGFNYEMGCCFDDRMIEDFWISYYCVTTDLTDSGANITCAYAHVSLAPQAYMRVHMRVCMRMSALVCMYVCMYICREKPQSYTHTHTHMHEGAL
jgi:hypothetical protein